MEHATLANLTTHPPPLPISAPPLPISAPPLTAAEIAILTAPPPPFPGPSHSVDLSPLEFLLALVAVVTIPALIYTFIFGFGCPFLRRRSEQSPGELSAATDDPRKVEAAAVSELRYQKDSHVKEIGCECPVCLSAFSDGEKLRQLSGCKHSFHADCIDLWLRNHSNCPICRATVAGKRPKSSAAAAPARDDDLQQGLPDASALV